MMTEADWTFAPAMPTLSAFYIVATRHMHAVIAVSRELFWHADAGEWQDQDGKPIRAEVYAWAPFPAPPMPREDETTERPL